MADTHISLRRCRELLGSACPGSDSEVEALRDSILALASVLVDCVPRVPESLKATMTFDATLRALSPLEAEMIRERAAIIEFEGGLTRSAAEDAALSERDLVRKSKDVRSASILHTP